MHIKRIELDNYKRFNHLVIDEIPETAKLVVLVGPNGTGKSALFDAFLLKSLSSRINQLRATSQPANITSIARTGISPVRPGR